MFEPETFKTFSDDPKSPFYRSPGLSPQETWAEIYEHFRHTISAITYEARRHPISLKRETLREIHHDIFVPLFPANAGRFRGYDAHGEPEHVSYGIDVGTSLTARTRTMQGAHPDRIVEQLDRAFAEFGVRLAALEAEEAVLLSEAVLAPATLYAKVLRIHPFVDGNLRAGFALFQGALVRLGLPQVVFPMEEHDHAIAYALRTDRHHSYEPLASLLATAIKGAT